MAVGLVAGAAAGCAKEEVKSADAVKVVLTDAGCEPSPTQVGAGARTFEVTNDGANAVSEAELLAANGQSILGERGNITPGLSGAFSLTLAEGTYKVYCPGAKQDTWEFTVKGGDKVADWHTNPALVKAVEGYADYVEAQADELVARTEAFATAVDAGDIDAAKKAYVAARLPYERIEPVAESFGDLDPRIDGRLGDNGDEPGDFIGFHRIEQALWADDSLEAMSPIAADLVTDVKELRKLIAEKCKSYEPNEVTNGAVELMNEVLSSKITGEEERYSHIDLVDFQANFYGSMKTVDLLRPVLEKSAPDLLDKIDAEAMTAGELVPGGLGSPEGVSPDTGEAYGSPPANLTITIGYGPDLFDDRFGLAAARPAALGRLPRFPNDAIQAGISGGDVCLQACADDPLVAYHAIRNLTFAGVGVVTMRRMQSGFGRTSSTSLSQATARNLFGFKDGTRNVRSDDTGLLDRWVWARGSGPIQGDLASGLFFIAFTSDPDHFTRVQRRLAGADPLDEYIRHISSAVFACPRGPREGENWGETNCSGEPGSARHGTAGAGGAFSRTRRSDRGPHR